MAASPSTKGGAASALHRGCDHIPSIAHTSSKRDEDAALAGAGAEAQGDTGGIESYNNLSVCAIRQIAQKSESFNSMLVLSGMRIPCYLPRIPRPYYGCSPYPIVCLLCCLFHALHSLLSTLCSLLRRRLSLCSAGASLRSARSGPCSSAARSKAPPM